MDALKQIAQASMKKDAPVVNVGDTVKVHVQITEGDKSRIQVFEGTVIAKKHGGISETFTVRRVAHGCGIERVSCTISVTELVRLPRSRKQDNSSYKRVGVCRLFLFIRKSLTK